MITQRQPQAGTLQCLWPGIVLIAPGVEAVAKNRQEKMVMTVLWAYCLEAYVLKFSTVFLLQTKGRFWNFSRSSFRQLLPPSQN